MLAFVRRRHDAIIPAVLPPRHCRRRQQVFLLNRDAAVFLQTHSQASPDALRSFMCRTQPQALIYSLYAVTLFTVAYIHIHDV